MSWSRGLQNRWHRASRVARLVVIIVPVLLIAFRLALPYAIKSYANHQLNKAADYSGHIGTVTVQLWRGAYRIKEISIFKMAGRIPEPLFAARQVDLSIQWKELFHGSLVGEVRMKEPRLNFVAGPTPEQSQSGKNEQWDKMLESLFPLRLNRLEIQEGQVHFQNHYSEPPVDIFVKDLVATATNLSNSRGLKQELPAGVMARGKALGEGGFDLDLKLNPMAPAPTYEVTCQLTNVDLTSLNDFLKAYGKFDVEHGKFALYTSVAAKDGKYEGYLKVFFENLNLFEWEKERKKNALEVFWQAIVGTLATVFKNQPNDSLATRVPISGSYAGTDVGVWSAISSLLRNAFIRALVPKVDEQITVDKVERTEEQKKMQRTNHPPTTMEKGAERLKKTGGGN